MKRLYALIMAALMLFSGCAQQGAKGTQAAPQDTVSGASGERGGWGNGGRMQLPENQSRVFGKIKEIYGNEIELQVGTMKMPAGASGDFRVPGASGGQGIDSEQREKIRERAEEWQGSASGAPEGNLQGNNRRQNGRQGGAGFVGGARQGAFSGGVELEYTGETKTITIPVGLKLTTGMGPNAKEADFTQLAKDNIIMVIVEKGGDGSEKVVSVQLLSQ